MDIRCFLRPTVRALFSCFSATRRPVRAKRSLLYETLEVRQALHGDTHSAPPVVHTDPRMAAEHAAVMRLVDYSSVTHRAVRDGTWDDPGTWDRGIPSAGANVLIPEAIDVVLDSIQREALRTVRVDGLLEFYPRVDTQLTVDTLVVAPGGSLEMGTAEQPIIAGASARIVIADRGPIDVGWDPTRVSRGIISHGEVSIHGREITPFLPVEVSVAAGARQIRLTGVPSGWRVGDRLLLSGTEYGKHEEATIRGIQGSVVTVDPLAYNHTLPEAGLTWHVANLSRNVVVASANPEMIDRRGHVMFMHSDDVEVRDAAFEGLGRTDKSMALNSARFDGEGKLLAGSGTNQVGRYAVHFHRAGLEGDGPAPSIQGSVVVGTPGWGIVNHHSRVVAEENLVYSAFGAAFVAEAGDELGAFRNNLAVYTLGSGEGTNSRRDNREPEYGHEGVGFWVQGSGVDLLKNIASEHQQGFAVYGRGLKEGGVPTFFPSERLPDRSWGPAHGVVQTGAFPLQFRQNLAYASEQGLSMFYHREFAGPAALSEIDRFTAWNVDIGVFPNYTSQLRFDEPLLLGREGARFGLLRHESSSNFTVYGGRIEGFEVGVILPFRGKSSLHGIDLDNQIDVVSESGMLAGGENRLVNVRFARNPTADPLAVDQQYIAVQSALTPKGTEMPSAFDRSVGALLFNDRQLYRAEQAADYVPFPMGTAATEAPAELVGKTNRQLLSEYGLAWGGEIAPDNAVWLEGTNTLIGARGGARNFLEQASPKLVNTLEYQLAYRTAPAGPVTTESEAVRLQPGWNVLTRQIGGEKRSFLVYADVVKATFQPDPEMQWGVHPDDLLRGFTIRGTISDQFHSGTFVGHFKFERLALQTRPDGTKYANLAFMLRDFAGNSTHVRLELRPDAKAPRQTPDPEAIVVNPFRRPVIGLLGQAITARQG